MNAPAPSPLVEDRTGSVLLGKLKVLRLIGQGGMGQVYEVEHLITRHRRALKIMHSRYATSSESVARFIREAGVAGKLRTPHVVETYDAGQLEDGSPYVMMELLRGESLASFFETPASIPSGRLVGIVCQMLEGLLVAHEAGIIHRDVKPDNVFVSRDERQTERVRLLDFGISKFTSETQDYAGTLTSDGAMMGTPFYMSPEQASGARAVDERADLYSVGVILYEGLARRRPFEAVSLPALVIKIHAGEHVPLGEVAPDLPDGLADVVERAMHVNAGLRYASARDLLAALVPYADSTYVASLHTMKEVAGAATVNAPGGGVKQSAVHTAAPKKEAPPAAPRPAWVMPTAVAAVVTALVIAAAFVVGRASGPSTAPSTTTAAAPPASPPTTTIAAPPPSTPPTPPPSVAPPPTSTTALPEPPASDVHRPRPTHVHEPSEGPAEPPTTRTRPGGILRDPSGGSAFGE